MLAKRWSVGRPGLRGLHCEKNVTTGVVTKYYYLGGQHVAMRQGGTLYYLHGDHDLEDGARRQPSPPTPPVAS